jgi:hypothetical protein
VHFLQGHFLEHFLFALGNIQPKLQKLWCVAILFTNAGTTSSYLQHLLCYFSNNISTDNMTVHLSIDARVDVDADSGRDGSAATSTSSSSSSPKPPPPLPPIDTLFVWDFDWTIVDCNSDEYVPAQFLGTDEMERRLRRYVDLRGPTRWHECVSDVVNECVEECDLSTPGDVRAAAARMPYLDDVRGAIEDVGGRGKEGGASSSSSFSSSCYGQAIISDGNDCFIKAFLNENGMGGHFTHGIETNMGRWEENRGGGTTEVDDSSSTGGGGGGGGGAPLLLRGGQQ